VIEGETEEGLMEEENEQEIHQDVMTLPYLEEEIPVLFLQDGTRYIPVTALCHLLGLRKEREIPRWRKLVLWGNARKLPFYTATRGKRLVWCLHLGALPLWCSCFDWSKVSPGRQEQLRQAIDAWDKQAEQVHQQMVSSYQQLRRMLFDVLTTYADANALFSWYKQHLPLLLEGFDAQVEIEALLDQGRNLIAEVTALARSVVQEQATLPMMDAVQFNADEQVVETFSLPLFPIISPEARAQFFTYIALLTQWHHDIATVLKAYGYWRAEDNEW